MKIFNPDRQLYREARTGTVFMRLDRALLKATGADRLDLLHRLSTNATRDLAAGQETSTILTSDKGRVVEVVRVIAFEDHALLLLGSAGSASARAFLDRYTIMDDFTAEDIGSEYGVFGLYGAGSRRIVMSLMHGEPPNAGTFSHVTLDGGRIIVLRDARLNGTSGFLLLASTPFVGSLAEQLRNAGVIEIDDATYQTLRIESGIPAAGQELSEQYNPLEAGLATMINWTKGCYIGQEVIARLDTYDKVQRHLVGLRFQGRVDTDGDTGIELVNDEGKKVGVVTSAAFSPSLEETIALAYVRTQHAIPGATLDAVTADDGGKQIAQATITRLPFDL